MIPLEASIRVIPVDGPRAGSASVIQRQPIVCTGIEVNFELDFNHQPIHNPCIPLCALNVPSKITRVYVARQTLFIAVHLFTDEMHFPGQHCLVPLPSQVVGVGWGFAAKRSGIVPGADLRR